MDQQRASEEMRTQHGLNHDSATDRRSLFLSLKLSADPDFNPNGCEDAPYGRFQGRPIICGATRVRGGIFPGVSDREAIVVDESYGRLEVCYTNLMVEYVATAGSRTCDVDKMLACVCRIVERTISLRPELVPGLHAKRGIGNNTKVALDYYVKNGYGAERHQVLLAAYLLEKLIERGMLEGRIHLEVRLSEDMEEHERVIFIPKDGRLLAFDPSRERRQRILRNQLLNDNC